MLATNIFLLLAILFIKSIEGAPAPIASVAIVGTYRYECPPKWIYGHNCGRHWCYQRFSVNPNQRLRMIDDNFCGTVQSQALPVSIACEEENNWLDRPPFSVAQFAVGLYIPQNIPWERNNFIWRDGLVSDYHPQWNMPKPGIEQEPNGLDFHHNPNEKVVVYSKKHLFDIEPNLVEFIACKVGAHEIYIPPPSSTAASYTPPTSAPALADPVGPYASNESPDGIYICPKATKTKNWFYGFNCGKHNCYSYFSVESSKRSRMIEDNFCENQEHGAFPSSIACEEENNWFYREPFYTKAKNRFAVGLYIKESIPWERNNFIWRDGLVSDYHPPWNMPNPGIQQEPNGKDYYNKSDEKAVIYSSKRLYDTPPMTIEYIACTIRATKKQEMPQEETTTKNPPSLTTPTKMDDPPPQLPIRKSCHT